MANPLFEALNRTATAPQIPDIMAQVREIQKTFRGDPKTEVERLINSGAMTREQFEQFGRVANQILGIK
jgi:hypothetical protein